MGRRPAAVSKAVVSMVGITGLTLAGCTGGHSRASSEPRAHPSTTTTTTAASSASSGVAGATAVQQAFVRVNERVRSSVVQITTSQDLGSGIVFDRRGDVVTNDHVIGSARTVTVQFTSGARVRATVVGTFPGDDLAVVRATGVRSAQLHPATFANSASLQVGDLVLAIGNPLALAGSVTNGIISAVGRTVQEPQEAPSPGAVINDAIQTSAPINPGNSGGALVDLAGQVVGIPTLEAVDPQIGGAAAGIGFAIPSNTVTTIASQLIRYGRVVNSHRAALGILAFQVYNAAGRPAGIGIEDLTKGSAAGLAGIRPGDVIVALDGRPVQTIAQLQRALALLAPGRTVRVTFIRGTRRRTVAVKLGSLPVNGS